MGRGTLELNDIVQMKKQHPCGTNSWKVIRMGADIRVKCQGCNRSVIMPRSKFVKGINKIEKANKDLQVNRKDKPFNWPSTFAKETKGKLRKDVTYRAESDLMKHGYMITGLTREQRWKILTQKVLKEIPLVKVVHTIASHVRNRKRQENGAAKYKYAITEWKHDLNRLKEEYYRSNFTWPSI